MMSVLEVGLFAAIGLVLLAPLLRAAVRKSWMDAGGAGTSVSAENRGDLRRRRAGWIGGILFAIAVLNGLTFHLHTRSLGGTADRSKQVEGKYQVSAHGWEYTEGNGPVPVRAEGRYYVSSRRRFTEVTEPQWRAVRAHEVALYITHALFFLAGVPFLGYSQGWWEK